MRALKVVMVVGVIAALATPTLAAGIPFRRAYNGPVVFDIAGFTTGTSYTGFEADGVTPVTDGQWYENPATELDRTRLAANGDALEINSDEDGWGIFIVNAIYEASYNDATRTYSQSAANPLWAFGDNDQEIVGAFWNSVDSAVVFEGDDTTVEIVGTEYHMYLQDENTAALGGVDDGRIEDGAGGWEDKYEGYGFDSTGAAIYDEEVLIADELPGYLDDVDLANGDPNVSRRATLTFSATGSGGFSAQGDGQGYLGFVGGTDWYENGGKFGLDTINPSANNNGTLLPDHMKADAWFKFNATGLLPGDTGSRDFTADIRDPVGTDVIPEPMTMIGVALAAGGLGGYLRKRRA